LWVRPGRFESGAGTSGPPIPFEPGPPEGNRLAGAVKKHFVFLPPEVGKTRATGGGGTTPDTQQKTLGRRGTRTGAWKTKGGVGFIGILLGEDPGPSVKFFFADGGAFLFPPVFWPGPGSETGRTYTGDTQARREAG